MQMRPGTFIDEDGKQLDAPTTPDAAFPILCGPWPNQHEHCIQRMCSCCGDPVGLSPRGLAYHEALPELRPLLCKLCFALLMALAQEGVAWIT